MNYVLYMHCNKCIYLAVCERAVPYNVLATLLGAAVSENKLLKKWLQMCVELYHIFGFRTKIGCWIMLL